MDQAIRTLQELIVKYKNHKLSLRVDKQVLEDKLSEVETLQQQIDELIADYEEAIFKLEDI